MPVCRKFAASDTNDSHDRGDTGDRETLMHDNIFPNVIKTL